MNYDPSNIQLITFDLDDTLWDGKRVIRHAEQTMQAWLDIHVPLIAERISRDEMRDRKIAFAKSNKHLIHRVSSLRLKFLAELFKEFDLHNSDELAHQCYQTFYHARQNVRLFEGVENALSLLSQEYRIGAITNGNSDLSIIGVNHLFEFAFSAEDFSAAKPSPDMFDAAIEMTGLRPEQCIHVGDHPEHDVLGAYAAGWQAIWLDDGSHQWCSEIRPSKVIHSVAELLDLLPSKSI